MRGSGRGREREGKGGKREGEGNGEGGGMKEDRYERRKTSKKERTPLTFLLGGCFDGGEAKKTKNGEEKNTPYKRCITAKEG